MYFSRRREGGSLLANCHIAEVTHLLHGPCTDVLSVLALREGGIEEGRERGVDVFVRGELGMGRELGISQ